MNNITKKIIINVKYIISVTLLLIFNSLSSLKIANAAGATSLQNPLKSNNIVDFLFAILDILLTFALPIIVLFIIYAGFLFVTAQGDTSKITTARSALTWSVIGGVIILGAKLILEVIKNTVAAL